MECGVGNVATVWDGEVAGMAGGLARARQSKEQRIVILADSKAAIAAVRKAGRTGRARSRHLQKVVNTLAEIKEGGEEAKLGWVKAHMGIFGNEPANVLAKNAAEGVPPGDHEKCISGGVLQPD